jgi:ATP-dependent DNA ligase
LYRLSAVKSQASSEDWKSRLARLQIYRRRNGRKWALAKEEMKNSVWLKPELVAQIEFTEWRPDGHLRNSKFVGLREDVGPREDEEADGVAREPGS